MTIARTERRQLPTPVIEDLDALAAFIRHHPSLPPDPAELAEVLYQGWYLAIAPPEPPAGTPAPAELDLASALDAAHAGSLVFEPGWVAERVSSVGRVEAVHGERRRIVRPGEYVDLDRPGRLPEPTDRLRLVKPLSWIEGGFWVTRSMSWLDGSSGPLTRLYVNVRLAGAATAVALLTAALEDAATPYALKVSTQLRDVQRADALVLYVPRGRFADLHGALERVVSSLADRGELAPATPRLTARLRPGVGAADGDGTGSSFGQERCTILAHALAVRREPIDALYVAALGAEGLDPSRPYLSPQATHDYAPFA